MERTSAEDNVGKREADKLERWLAHPELRGEFNTVDPRCAVGQKRQHAAGPVWGNVLRVLRLR